MGWLQVMNAFALAGWTWLLLHSVLPAHSGLVARDEFAGQGLRARRAQWLFGALQTFCYAEVSTIAYHRHCVLRSMKGVEQTVLGLGICVFRSTIAVFAIPKLDNAALHQALVGGWALADVLRYIALLSKRPSLQLLRRIASTILFLLVAIAEVCASWLTLDSFTLGVRRWMLVQMCATTMGLPVGAYLFLKSARKVRKDAKRAHLWSTVGGWMGRESFKCDFGEKAVLAPAHGHVPIYRPRLPGALCRGSQAELSALKPTGPSPPSRSLWPHLEELVRMTEVPIGLPGATSRLARTLRTEAELEQQAERAAKAEPQAEPRQVMEERHQLPSFDAEAALRALREERLERERRCRFLDFPRPDQRLPERAVAVTFRPGPPGPGSSGPSIFEVEVSWKSFQHAGAGGAIPLRSPGSLAREPACSFVMRPPVVEWESPSRPERERTAHRRPSARSRRSSATDLRAREKLGKLLVAHYEVRFRKAQVKTAKLMRVVLGIEEEKPESILEGLTGPGPHGSAMDPSMDRAMVEGRVVAIEDTFLEVLLTQAEGSRSVLFGRLFLGPRRGASSHALGLCVGDDIERLRVVGRLPDGALCLVPEDRDPAEGFRGPPGVGGEMEEKAAKSYSRQELLEQRRSVACVACGLGLGGAETPWAPQTAPYREEDFEAMLLQALLSGQLPPPWWHRCSAALKRKALLVALRVGSMQAVYAMQPESAAFRAQLQCFEPDGSFLSEAMSGIWDDAERAAATRRTSGPSSGPSLKAANLDALQRVASEEGRGSAVAWLLQRGAPVAALLPEEPGPAALGIRLRGLKLLQDLGQQAAPAAAAIAGCLRDPEVRGRRAAAEALAALEVTGDLAPRAADPQCRVAAAVALGSLGRDGCLAAEEALWHQDLDVRGLACVALEASKEASTSKVLVRWLQEGGASEVSLRARALQALARLLGSAPALERELALAALAAFAVHATDPDAAVREASLLGLGALCHTCESCRELALPTLAAGLDDSEEAVREAAASALAVEEWEKGVVDESEPSSSRVVLRVLSILDRRAGDGMPSAIRRIARFAAIGRPARAAVVEVRSAQRAQSSHQELTSNEEKLLVDMEEAEIAIASLLGPPNKLSSGAVKQAWEVVHREASEGWVPKAREKGAPEDAKAMAPRRCMGCMCPQRSLGCMGQEEEHPEGLVQLATESVHHGACKEESAAEEQVHPLPASPGKCRNISSLNWRWRLWGGAGHGRAMDKAGSSAFDERGLWVLRRVSTIFAVRKEKLEKFLQLLGEDANSSRLLNHFLNEVEVPAVFFHLSGSGESCSVSTDLPTAAQLKKKVLALVRSKQEVEIDLGPGRRPCVVFVELAKGIMDLINSYCHSVYLSVLMNPANQRGWSDLITRDLLDKFHGFLASLHVTVGLRQGQTLLPLPPREAVQEGAGPGKGSASASSKDRVHVLEGAVITWTKQVRYVLKQEPEHIFREGSPQPDAELQFWRSRANNLNSIHMQLQMEGVKRVLRFLDANKSTYVAPFARLQKEVEDGREEANDNVKFLKALERHVNALLNETQDFEALEQVFDDVFHVLLLVWRHSKYYNSLARLAVIVRQICNSLIAQATRYISGSSVFEMILQSEALECYDMLERVLRAIESLQART
eukprot:s4821_g1.t2